MKTRRYRKNHESFTVREKNLLTLLGEKFKDSQNDTKQMTERLKEILEERDEQLEQQIEKTNNYKNDS